MSASAAMSRLRAGNRHRLGRRAERRFAEHDATTLDLAPQDGVPLRIDDVEPAADDGDRCGGAGRQRAGVSRTVDAEARPDTTATPADASSKPNSYAMSTP